MKRYRDLKIYCNEGQSALELLDVIEKSSEDKSYNKDRGSSLGTRDTLKVYINIENLPYSRIVLCAISDEHCVSIVNIVPMPESGTSHIPPETYNQLLDYYRNDVLQSISQTHGNRIETNNEDYSIEDIIPHSFEKLDIWLNGHPLSSHQNDTQRWYNFVISLHQTGESLSLDTFGKYLQERCEWSDEDIDRMELRLESQLDLLEYYDDHK